MKLNLSVDQILEVKVREKSYPVQVAGHGIPCMCIGLGTLMQRTLSDRFKKAFKVYSSDLYWNSSYKLAHPQLLSLNSILEDIVELSFQLQLSKFVLLAHSAFGVAALEFAKKYPNRVSGIILIGSPPYLNASFLKENQAYFEKHAEKARKKIDAMRRAIVAKENLNLLSPSLRFLREYIWRDGPRYWHDPEFDCTALWKDLSLDDSFEYYLTHILPSNDIERGLEQIHCPVFLAAGVSDYDCCPLMHWEKIRKLPPHMVISKFDQSGHWPHYEEQALFDKRVISWMLEYKS